MDGIPTQAGACAAVRFSSAAKAAEKRRILGGYYETIEKDDVEHKRC